MFTCKKILAVLDPTLEEQPALLRAINMAEKTAASIIVFSCIYDKSYDMTAVLSSDERFNMKKAMMEHEQLKVEALLKSIGSAIDMKIVIAWQKKHHESVIDSCNEYACDLIIKATQKHGLLSSTLFTANDWHILRKSAANVLLVKSQKWPENAQIIASIGVSAQDDDHIYLSDQIAETATQMSVLLSSNVHLVNSFPGVPVQMAVEVPNFSPEVYNKSVKDRHVNKMKKLGSKFEIADSHIHVLEGLPEDIIPEMCKKYEASLLVIGSVGRKGISAALLGNTAELVIDAIDCDTMVVKAN
ncbi:MAG: universal stress protein E [Glaciecola sp.]|jgi:universal stress protein E